MYKITYVIIYEFVIQQQLSNNNIYRYLYILAVKQPVVISTVDFALYHVVGNRSFSCMKGHDFGLNQAPHGGGFLPSKSLTIRVYLWFCYLSS